MKVKELARVIRKIVREEVQKEVKSILTEQQLNSNPSANKEKLTLTEALQQTESEEYPTMQTFNASDARAGFAAMQGGINRPPVHTDLNGRAVKDQPELEKALTRDYSDLVKRFKK